MNIPSSVFYSHQRATEHPTESRAEFLWLAQITLQGYLMSLPAGHPFPRNDLVTFVQGILGMKGQNMPSRKWCVRYPKGATLGIQWNSPHLFEYFSHAVMGTRPLMTYFPGCYSCQIRLDREGSIQNVQYTGQRTKLTVVCTSYAPFSVFNRNHTRNYCLATKILNR